jgi:hypothetical protein
MPGRAMTIDEAIEKIGNFSRQDAIDLIESSQGVTGGKGKPGHPLEHCEMTTRAWPIPRSNDFVLIEPRDGADGDTFRSPDAVAQLFKKKAHTMSWTDLHLIQAIRDLFLGKGAYMALHNLKEKGIGARLTFVKPTSHTTNALTAMATKIGKFTFHASAPHESLTESYMGIFDHCPGQRLHLQTLFAEPDNSHMIRIAVKGAKSDDKPFVAEFHE